MSWRQADLAMQKHFLRYCNIMYCALCIDNINQCKVFLTVLKIVWTDKIKNEILYKISKQKQWTKIIQTRRLSWCDHLLRLPPNCPARQALNECKKLVPRPQGRPVNSWLVTIRKDLDLIGIIGDGQIEAQNRALWNNLIK